MTSRSLDCETFLVAIASAAAHCPRTNMHCLSQRHTQPAQQRSTMHIGSRADTGILATGLSSGTPMRKSQEQAGKQGKGFAHHQSRARANETKQNKSKLASINCCKLQGQQAQCCWAHETSPEAAYWQHFACSFEVEQLSQRSRHSMQHRVTHAQFHCQMPHC